VEVFGLSYSNGIGSPQQNLNTQEAGVASRIGVGKAAANSVSSQYGAKSTIPVDEANLSTTASVVTTALTMDDARTVKVAALQQAIASGTYNVSSSDVADKVISALLR